MKGKTIFVDLDGTLLTSSKDISTRNKKAVEDFRKNGGEFSIATGRVLESMKHFLTNINVDLPIVLYNGALVYDTKTKKIINLYCLKKTVVKNIIVEYKKTFEELDITLIGFNIEGIYLHRETEYTRKQFDKDRILNFKILRLDSFKNKDFIKLMFVGKRDNLLKFKETLGEINAFTSDVNILEILPEGISKWSGIEKAIEYRGSLSKHIYTFGDNQNDLDMIKKADTGIAMKNSCDTVLKEIKNVTEYNNDDDGVGRYIEKYIL